MLRRYFVSILEEQPAQFSADSAYSAMHQTRLLFDNSFSSAIAALLACRMALSHPTLDAEKLKKLVNNKATCFFALRIGALYGHPPLSILEYRLTP